MFYFLFSYSESESASRDQSTELTSQPRLTLLLKKIMFRPSAAQETTHKNI